MSQIHGGRQAWCKCCRCEALSAATDWPGPTHARENSLMKMQYLFYGVDRVCFKQSVGVCRSSVSCQYSRTD